LANDKPGAGSAERGEDEAARWHAQGSHGAADPCSCRVGASGEARLKAPIVSTSLASGSPRRAPARATTSQSQGIAMPRSSSRPLVVAASAAAVSAAFLAACAGGMSSMSSGGMSASPDMSFFVSSRGSGRGGDLGGLAGADQLCGSLASAVGAGGKTWHAYLSTQGPGSVNARDRIGTGPWRNAKGVVVAQNVSELHGNNNLTKQTALTEKGDVVNGRGDTPNMHDILTGSQPDGTTIKGEVDTTCGNWTRSGEGAAMLGHSDRTGLDESVPAKSWNSSHQSRGCSIDALKSTGSDARIYCFAAN
jgi:hypothetical protein